jgi:hypothetical protein
MMTPNAHALAVPELRETLGLSAERPVDVRDIIAVPRTGTGAMLEEPASLPPVALALGDWPEAWLHAPETAPRYLVTLRGLASPYQISGVWDIDSLSWGLDTGARPSFRVVPVTALAYVASAALAGRMLDTGVTFGWLSPEEQFAFL